MLKVQSVSLVAQRTGWPAVAGGAGGVRKWWPCSGTCRGVESRSCSPQREAVGKPPSAKLHGHCLASLQWHPGQGSASDEHQSLVPIISKIASPISWKSSSNDIQKIYSLNGAPILLDMHFRFHVSEVWHNRSHARDQTLRYDADMKEVMSASEIGRGQGPYQSIISGGVSRDKGCVPKSVLLLLGLPISGLQSEHCLQLLLTTGRLLYRDKLRSSLYAHHEACGKHEMC